MIRNEKGVGNTMQSDEGSRPDSDYFNREAEAMA